MIEENIMWLFGPNLGVSVIIFLGIFGILICLILLGKLCMEFLM